VISSVTITYSSDWEYCSEFPTGGNDEGRHAIIAAPEWQVREQWFTANVELRVASAAIGYVRTPVIDYAMALRFSLEALAADGASSFSVAGGPRLEMARRDAVVDIRHGNEYLASGVEFIDMMNACVLLRRNFIDDVTSRHPELLLNDLIESLFRESGLRERGRERFNRHSHAVKLRRGLAY
jgi:hypothetical protein